MKSRAACDLCGGERGVSYCEELDCYVCEACCEECGECDEREG